MLNTEPPPESRQRPPKGEVDHIVVSPQRSKRLLGGGPGSPVRWVGTGRLTSLLARRTWIDGSAGQAGPARNKTVRDARNWLRHRQADRRLHGLANRAFDRRAGHMTSRDLGALAAPGLATRLQWPLEDADPGQPVAGEIVGPGLDPDDPPTPGSDRRLSVVGSPIARPSTPHPGRPGAVPINVNRARGGLASCAFGPRDHDSGVPISVNRRRGGPAGINRATSKPKAIFEASLRRPTLARAMADGTSNIRPIRPESAHSLAPSNHVGAPPPPRRCACSWVTNGATGCGRAELAVDLPPRHSSAPHISILSR